MNGSGGVLLVGVTDAGEVLGLDRDLATFGNSWDRFEAWINGSLLGKCLGSNLVSRLVKVHFQGVRGVQVAVIEVDESDIVAWVDDEHCFVRNGNQTNELKGRNLAAFVQSKGFEG